MPRQNPPGNGPALSAVPARAGRISPGCLLAFPCEHWNLDTDDPATDYQYHTSLVHPTWSQAAFRTVPPTDPVSFGLEGRPHRRGDQSDNDLRALAYEVNPC